MSRLLVIARALCDAENQPHQWSGAPKELRAAIIKAVLGDAGEVIWKGQVAVLLISLACAVVAGAVIGLLPALAALVGILS